MISPIEIWIYRVLCVTLGVGLAWEIHTVNRLEDMYTAREQALLQANLDNEKAYNEKLVNVTTSLQLELDTANNLARSRGADLERLRNANARLQARAKSAPENPDREALARCSELLTEGAGLVAEGERLLLKHGAEHDAVLDLTY